MPDLEEKKRKLIQGLIDRGFISSSEVIGAMEMVQREIFVPDDQRQYSYSDTPLRIGEGQTISAPHMVGMMLELLELKKGMKVLEVGGGSGYHATMVAAIVGSEGHVYTIERIKELAVRAEANIKKAGMMGRVSVIHGDGSKGHRLFAPYDRIWTACGAPSVPLPLMAQLEEDGVIVIPIGGMHYQDLIKIIKRPGGKVIRESHGGCAFVPMLGEHGY